MPVTVTEYDDALEWIFNRINYERISPQRSSEHFRLERIEQLLALIDAPQQRIPVVHIAGTKGKGSTAAILSSIMRASGICSGLYTSPHIHRFEERMLVDGRQPSEQEMVELVAELQTRLAAAPPGLDENSITYFEVATLLAWMFFDRNQVELVVLETGLGGRLDTTNVCNPLVTIITAIGLDHTDILGDTIELIAREKAGIIKPGIPVLTSATQPDALDVILDVARENECECWQLPGDIAVESINSKSPAEQILNLTTPVRTHRNLHLHLAGKHQARNAAVAVAAADLLFQTDPRISEKAIRCGVEAARWPLRFEILGNDPVIVLDVAHNPDAVTALAETLRSGFGVASDAVLLFGTSSDKDSAEMLRILFPLFDTFVFTEFRRNPRATPASTLAEMATGHQAEQNLIVPKEIYIAADPESALAKARSQAGEGGLICVTGSLFLAAEIRELLPM